MYALCCKADWFHNAMADRVRKSDPRIAAERHLRQLWGWKERSQEPGIHHIQLLLRMAAEFSMVSWNWKALKGPCSMDWRQWFSSMASLSMCPIVSDCYLLLYFLWVKCNTPSPNSGTWNSALALGLHQLPDWAVVWQCWASLSRYLFFQWVPCTQKQI